MIQRQMSFSPLAWVARTTLATGMSTVYTLWCKESACFPEMALRRYFVGLDMVWHGQSSTTEPGGGNEDLENWNRYEGEVMLNWRLSNRWRERLRQVWIISHTPSLSQTYSYTFCICKPTGLTQCIQTHGKHIKLPPMNFPKYGIKIQLTIFYMWRYNKRILSI